jgi:molybdenum cofactor cytidylyltransferase
VSINTVILAAGKSERFKGIKQLAVINNTSMLNLSISKLQSIKCGNIYVALGANIEKILNSLPLDVIPIVSPNCHLGLGHTISDVITKLENTCEHILFCPADQILIPETHYKQLITASLSSPDKIIATLSNKKYMAPAIFPKKYFQDLINLKGDKGAGILFKTYRSEILPVSCEQAKFDIDTQEDYLTLKHKLEQDLKNNQPEQV